MVAWSTTHRSRTPSRSAPSACTSADPNRPAPARRAARRRTRCGDPRAHLARRRPLRGRPRTLRRRGRACRPAGPELASRTADRLRAREPPDGRGAGRLSQTALRAARARPGRVSHVGDITARDGLERARYWLPVTAAPGISDPEIL